MRVKKEDIIDVEQEILPVEDVETLDTKGQVTFLVLANSLAAIFEFFIYWGQVITNWIYTGELIFDRDFIISSMISLGIFIFIIVLVIYVPRLKHKWNYTALSILMGLLFGIVLYGGMMVFDSVGQINVGGVEVTPILLAYFIFPHILIAWALRKDRKHFFFQINLLFIMICTIASLLDYANAGNFLEGFLVLWFLIIPFFTFYALIYYYLSKTKYLGLLGEINQPNSDKEITLWKRDLQPGEGWPENIED